MKGRWTKYGRIALLLLGLGLLGYAVHVAGPRTLLQVAQQGLWFLPFIAFFCGSFFVLEGFGQRAMLGEEALRIPLPVFARATLSSYVASVLFPLGRAGSEVMRISAYAPWVGAARATAASATFQIANLTSTGIYGALAYLVAGSALGFGSLMAWTLLLHALGSGLLAGLVLLVVRRGTPGQRLARVFPSIVVGAELFDRSTLLSLTTFLRAMAYCLVARVAEVAQYAVVLVAVGVAPSLERSILAGAIHAVGATVGEAIPGQIGTVEGAFVYFSAALGLEGEQARAIMMPLLVRVAQFGLAASALVVLQFTNVLPGPDAQPRSS